MTPRPVDKAEGKADRAAGPEADRRLPATALIDGETHRHAAAPGFVCSFGCYHTRSCRQSPGVASYPHTRREERAYPQVESER